jgi:hypothetical protein
LATVIVAAAWAELSNAQHADVLVQSVGGRLTTGSADFDSGRWTLGRRVYSGEFDDDFAVNNPGFNALAAGSPALPPGSQALPGDNALGWDFLAMMIDQSQSNLFYWDGLESDGVSGITPDDVRFGAVPVPEYSLSLFDKSQAKFSVTGTDQIVPGGVIDNTAADGSLHRHRFYLLEAGTMPPDGIYLFSMRLWMANLQPSKPILMVFGTIGSSVAALDSAAVPWVTAHVDTLVPEGVPGDYNMDGSVDAADYVVWRSTLGQMGADLAADGDGSGTIDHDDFVIWRARFGATAGSGPGLAITGDAPGAAPEPASVILLLAVSGFRLRATRRVIKRTI